MTDAFFTCTRCRATYAFATDLHDHRCSVAAPAAGDFDSVQEQAAFRAGLVWGAAIIAWAEAVRAFVDRMTAAREAEAYRLEMLKHHGQNLYRADPGCDHDIVHAPGGGVKCRKCLGWYCL